MYDSVQISDGGYAFQRHDGQRQGAAIVMKDPARLQKLKEDAQMKLYLLKHHQSWCRFVQENLPDIPREAIVTVSACVKTTEWAIASIFDGPKGSLNFRTPDEGHWTSSGWWAPEGGMTWQARTVPFKNSAQKPSSRSDERPQAPEQRSDFDQTLFIQYYQLRHKVNTENRYHIVSLDVRRKNCG